MQAFEMQDDNAAPQGNIWNEGFSIDRQALMQRERTPKGRICCRICLGSIALITSVFTIWVISKRVFDNAAALEAKSMHGSWIFDKSSMFGLLWDESKPGALAFSYVEYKEESQTEGFNAWREETRDAWKGHLHQKIRDGKHFWEGKVGKSESFYSDGTLVTATAKGFVSFQYTTHANQLPTIIFSPPGSLDKYEAIRADVFSEKITDVWKFVFKKTKMELVLAGSGTDVSLTMMDVTGTGNDIKCRLDRFGRGHLTSPGNACDALGRVDIYNDAWHETDPNHLTFMAQSDDPAQPGDSEGEKGKKNQKEYSAWRR